MSIEYCYEDSQGISTTTAQTWQEKTSLEISVQEYGYYRISWWLGFRSGSSDKSVSVRVRIDDETDFVEVSDSKIQWQPLSGFRLYALAPGIHHVRIEFRVDDEDGTAAIARATLDSWRAS